MQMFNKLGVSLVTQTFTKDAIGQLIPISVKKTVIGEKRNISGTEISEAGQRGIQPQFVVDVWSAEYNGAELVEIGGLMYHVYRTYQNQKNGKTELYLEERAQV